MRIFPVFVFVLLTLVLTPPAMAGDADQAARLQAIKAQRAEVARIRAGLEARLNTLGRELKHLDVAWIEARKQARQAARKVRQADTKLAALQKRQAELRASIRALQRRMRAEAGLAYRQSQGPGMWLDMLLGGSLTEIPHRQYMLSRLVARQQRDKRAFHADVEALGRTQTALEGQRQALDKLRREKAERLHALQAARRAKQALWRKVQRDERLQRQRDEALAREQAALKRLLAGLGSTLTVADKSERWKPMRKLKGHLPWPLQGRIVAGFHSRPAPGRPRLAGVQLAPRRHGGQVKAIAAGQVRFAGWFGGYGLMMILDHGDGLMTVYAHNDALYKRVGEWVDVGDVLADAGSTGWVRTTRLYFEVRDGGKPVNPRRWCRGRG